jgi:DNA-binding XRE family transcriptional regulator
MKTNWLWDTKLKEDRVREILGNERDPRFLIYADKLLARVRAPGEVFSWISREAFDRNWALIRSRMAKDAWSRTAVKRWDRVHEQAIPSERYDVAGQIKAARKARGFSQAQFAQKMGVIQQYVSSLEAGRENITLDTLRKIAGVLEKKVIVRFR